LGVSSKTKLKTIIDIETNKIMNDYNYYYPNRFRNKTKNFDNLYNEYKSVESSFGSAYKHDAIIQKYFGNNVSSLIKNSKQSSLLSYRRFDVAGCNIFHFKKELLELLDRTDVYDVRIENIKFPYSNFYISIRELAKKINSNENDDTIIDGFFVEFHDDSGEGLIYDYWISISVCGYSKNNEDKEFKWNVVDKIELSSGLTFENLNSTINDALDIEHELLKSHADNKDKDDGERQLNFALEEYKLLRDNLNLFVNCILYLTVENEDIENKFLDTLPSNLQTKLESAKTKHKKELVEKEFLQQGYSKIKIVGKKIITSISKGTSEKEVSTHWRRGHWRNQPVGQELKSYKLIWIKPTIVNKDKGEVKTGHIYER
jgi:hypothetical protein